MEVQIYYDLEIWEKFESNLPVCIVSHIINIVAVFLQKTQRKLILASFRTKEQLLIHVCSCILLRWPKMMILIILITWQVPLNLEIDAWQVPPNNIVISGRLPLNLAGSSLIQGGSGEPAIVKSSLLAVNAVVSVVQFQMK